MRVEVAGERTSEESGSDASMVGSNWRTHHSRRCRGLGGVSGSGVCVGLDGRGTNASAIGLSVLRYTQGSRDVTCGRFISHTHAPRRNFAEVITFNSYYIPEDCRVAPRCCSLMLLHHQQSFLETSISLDPPTVASPNLRTANLPR
jgi:hypothetical protein